MAGKGLALIFGEPKGKRDEMIDNTSEERSEEFPVEFEDASEAIFDAIRTKDSRGLTTALWDAIKAYEEAPHEEAEEPSDEGEY